MTSSNVIDLGDEEHTGCEAGASEGPLSGDGLFGMPDGKDARWSDPGVRLEDSERTRCEVWTRVMGYHRPVSAFNAGKRSEHKQRKYFVECRSGHAAHKVKAA